ncbi:MAG: GerMN domain-containing protein [Smithella sp.]|nr:GerMN domain-containing protein [Syntrophaceae bacterium]NTW76921.1 GerMN domain-containing protein [Syntrophaceae bacterium]
MATKRQRRFEELQDKKKKKSTRIFYFSLIMGGIAVLLIVFFVIVFNAVFPPVDVNAAKKKEKRLVIVYFSDSQERFLKPEKRYVFVTDETAQQVKEITKALLDGSKTKLVNTFPAGVSIKDVKVNDEGTAFISFSKNLTKLHPGGATAEMATIYSLTNSVTENVTGIKRVKILIDGKELPSIKGHISTKKAFDPDPELFAPSKEEKS